MLFLLINILINIGDAQPDPIIHIPVAINCNSRTSGSTTQENNEAYFQFDLSQSSYIEINTCGSDFDTHLRLMDENKNIIAFNDDGNDNDCGYLNAVIKEGPLAVGSYTIQVTSIFSGFGAYHLALQCDPNGTPTMPDLPGIPIQSECNFVEDYGPILPLDICSSAEYLDVPDLFNSRKYICNPAGNGVLMVTYENADCSGTGVTSSIPGGFVGDNPYYYNCAGSSSNCGLATLRQICIIPNVGETIMWTETYALDVCVDKEMFKCNDGILTWNEYTDDNCQNIGDFMEAPDDNDGECRYETICGCDLNRLNKQCDSGLDCPDCMQCCDKRKVCEF
eukprot:509051_1